MSAQLADELERAVALSKGLASSSSASSPLDGSPEAALDALRQAAGQRMEDRMVASVGEEGPARGFGGVKRLVGSLMDSLNEAKARLSDMTVRLEQP